MSDLKRIRIYLDTSDYARIYKHDSKDVIDVYNYLIEKKNNSEIEIGYSYPIIWELLQDYDENHKEDRISRAKCIKELCGRNVFLWFESLAKGHSFSRNGEWYPKSEDISIEGIAQKFIEHLTNYTYSSDRKARRKLQSKKNRHEILSKHKELFDLKCCENIGIPLTKCFIEKNYLRKYLLKEITLEEANNKYLNILSDPELFIVAYYEYYGGKNFFMDKIKKVADTFYESIVNIRIETQSANQLLKFGKAIEKLIKKNPKLDCKDHLNTIKSTRNILKNSSTMIEHFGFSQNLDSYMPKNITDIIRVYFKENVDNLQNKTNKSDVGNILHACYIPFCDLWRGDSKFAGMLIRHKIKYNEKIVPNLLELPDRIESMLKEKTTIPSYTH